MKPPANDRGDSRELATFNRGPRHDQAAEVVRWSLDTFTPSDGKPARYVSARVWFRGQDGAMHPTKRGLTIRASELVAVIKALCSVARELGVLEQKGAQNGGRDAV